MLVKMVVKMRGEVVTMKGEAKPGIPASLIYKGEMSVCLCVCLSVCLSVRAMEVT